MICFRGNHVAGRYEAWIEENGVRRELPCPTRFGASFTDGLAWGEYSTGSLSLSQAILEEVFGAASKHAIHFRCAFCVEHFAQLKDAQWTLSLPSVQRWVIAHVIRLMNVRVDEQPSPF